MSNYKQSSCGPRWPSVLRPAVPCKTEKQSLTTVVVKFYMLAECEQRVVGFFPHPRASEPTVLRVSLRIEFPTSFLRVLRLQAWWPVLQERICHDLSLPCFSVLPFHEVILPPHPCKTLQSDSPELTHLWRTYCVPYCVLHVDDAQTNKSLLWGNARLLREES